MARTRLVLAQDCIPAPVIADFDSAPMPANQAQPLLGPVLLGIGTGQVIMGFFGGETGFLYCALTTQDDETSGKREVDCHGFDGEGMEPPGFDPSVSGLGLDKKGVLVSPSRPWACFKRLAWLPLIWSR